MRRSIPAVARLVPVSDGWRIAVELLGERREGVLRLRPELTWMQQRRAIEERLRSWGVVAAPGTRWRRGRDGAVDLPLRAVGREAEHRRAAALRAPAQRTLSS